MPCEHVSFNAHAYRRATGFGGTVRLLHSNPEIQCEEEDSLWCRRVLAYLASRRVEVSCLGGVGGVGGLGLGGGGGGQDGPGRTPVFARACVRCVCLSSVLIYVNVLFVLFGHGMA